MRFWLPALITISGWPAKDPQARAFSGNTVTFANGTTMVFGSTTPGTSDSWQCFEGGRALRCDLEAPTTPEYVAI